MPAPTRAILGGENGHKRKGRSAEALRPFLYRSSLLALWQSRSAGRGIARVIDRARDLAVRPWWLNEDALVVVALIERRFHELLAAPRGAAANGRWRPV